MGAIGSLYASKCDKSLVDIHCVARSDYNHIKSVGIKLKQPNGHQILWQPKHCFPSISDVANNDYHYIVITTKATDNEAVASELKRIKKPKKALVIIQNGIDIELPFKTLFPDTTILSALAFVCVTKTGPATIHHQDYGHLVMGRFPQGHSSLPEQWNDFYKASDVTFKCSDNIQYERYKKLLWNAAFNPLSVITGGKNTLQLCSDPNHLQQIVTVMKEVQLVAKEMGYKLSDDIIEKNITATKKMKPYKTSMCVDWENKRCLEIDPILGNLIKCAQHCRCSVPEIKKLYDLLKPYNE